MSVRRRLLVSAYAVFAVSLGGLPAAHADPPAEPVLWSGVLHAPNGQPAGGDVVAYVRPPAAQLRPGDQLTEVGRVHTDGSGGFVLRALPSPAVRAAQDATGWVTVMVAAFGEQGMALGVDSVAWKPDPGVHTQSVGADHGRWVTSPAELFAAPGTFHATEAEEQAAVDTERPTTLILDRQRPVAIHATGASGGHPPAGRTCGLERSQEVGDRAPVAVGELHLGDAWGGTFEYTNTRSTSFQVGVSSAGRGWQVGGSESMTATSTMAQEKTILPAERQEPQLTTYRAELQFERFDWRCNKNLYDWEEISTLEPVSWPNGGMRETVGGDPPRCGSNKGWFSTVMPGGRLTRLRGSSITLDRAISVAGFTGSTTSAVTDGVRYEWFNNRPYHRAVCGSTAKLDQNTRAATSGMV